MLTVQPQNHTEVQSRIIRHVKGKSPGATVIFFAGIHGNEKAGVVALNNVLKTVEKSETYGQIYGVYGNQKALKVGKRFIDEDLNRIWITERIQVLESKTALNAEEEEQVKLYSFLKTILKDDDSPLYFIDFHTTSSKTLPFITINDALINRKFSKQFPLPIVLGIEEYLDGPLLSYLNKKGFVSLGFESGQHYEPDAVDNCEAFIHLALHHTGSLTLSETKQKLHELQLQKAAEFNTKIYEVVYRYHISKYENFEMLSGFKSFQPIEKGMLLAHSNHKPIYSLYGYELFMPLYQKKGDDGFFIIKNIPKIFLKLSAVLRQIKADNLLTLLPGISWHNKNDGVLKANLNIAQFMTKAIFHMLGYRNKHYGKTHLLLYNRERVAKNKLYKKTQWY